jgi:hypothetical protein
MDECDSGPGRHRSGANAALVCADASAAITSHIVCVRKKKVRTTREKRKQQDFTTVHSRCAPCL